MRYLLIAFCIASFNSLTMHAQENFFNIEAISEEAEPFIESKVFHLINEQRKLRSLPPLKWASPPAHSAREHSLNMANGLIPFGHTGAHERFDVLKVKIPSITRFGENVAYNFGYPDPAQAAVDAWMESPGHYSNIVGDYNLAGIGVAKNLRGEYYFTQIFLKANISLFTTFECPPQHAESYIDDSAIEWESE